jgi:hypothetical protein
MHGWHEFNADTLDISELCNRVLVACVCTRTSIKQDSNRCNLWLMLINTAELLNIDRIAFEETLGNPCIALHIALFTLYHITESNSSEQEFCKIFFWQTMVSYIAALLLC